MCECEIINATHVIDGDTIIFFVETQIGKNHGEVREEDSLACIGNSLS